MKPKHIQIDHRLLNKSAQAHPLRPIRTALTAQQLDHIEADLPHTLSELYRWMKIEDLVNTIPPQKLWTQLMTAPFICIPVAFGIGGIWWIFAAFGLLIGLLGLMLKWFIEGEFFSSKLNLLTLEPFILISKEHIIENTPMLHQLKLANKKRKELLQQTQQKKTYLAELLNDVEQRAKELNQPLDNDEHIQKLKHLEALEKTLLAQLQNFEDTLKTLNEKRELLLKKAELSWLSGQYSVNADFALRTRTELALDDFEWEHHKDELLNFLQKTDLENSL